ncbi:MAG: radical SAM protein [Planctomycetes bacterium]|nr:radical SAM protein [Planctomycetota bacterium]
MKTNWKIVPLSKGQLKDVRSSDVLDQGLFRACSTYRGGGGYDLFSTRTKEIFKKAYHQQFIVQLYGCHLDCPYCYVTRAGIWGKSCKLNTEQLVTAFKRAYKSHNCNVFHLMGGAPALQIKNWQELLNLLEQECEFPWVFHSDLLLTESNYKPSIIKKITHKNALYAINIKGLTTEEHLNNTRKPWNAKRFFKNLNIIESSDLPFYFTFTNIVNKTLLWRWYSKHYPEKLKQRKTASFEINLIEYKALKYVDEISWGKQASN